MTQRDATHEELALARKIAINLWPGDDTEYLFERDAARNAALSAIQQTTELMCHWHVKQADEADRQFLSAPAGSARRRNLTAGSVTCRRSVTALRNNDHLKQEAV